MIRRWRYYFGLAWRDLVRLRSATQHHVIIVAGICLPILMLLGLKRGHVETLRQDLITSPTGRQVTFWSAQKGELMNRVSVERLNGELPSIDVIIPESQRIVQLSSQVNGETYRADSVTLFATRPGDPLLGQLGITSPHKGANELIIGLGVAERLNAEVGQKVDVILARGRGDLAETAQVECTIAAVMPTEELDAAIGYVDLDVLDQFDAFGRGFRVPELGWSSAKVSAADTYSGYLIFCEAGNDLTEDDRRFLEERGFKLAECSQDPPAPLAKLLVPDFGAKIRIYEAATEQSYRDSSYRLRIAPSELSEATTADDVVIPWNSIRTATIDGHIQHMVGLSMPRRTWLREYFAQADLSFDYEAEALSFRSGGNASESDSLRWPLGSDAGVDLALAALPPSDDQAALAGSTAETEPKERILVVPANLLAWVQAHGDGVVEFDEGVQLFVPKQKPAVYDRARLYTHTIDDVPAAVQALAQRGFAVMSETGRITEIHGQDLSLQLLVWVVGIGVFLFGVLTVVSVLMDSTDRKRATIGILRVMGMSRSGVFASVLFRATAIGAAAAILGLLCGWGLTLALGWVPPADVVWLTWKPIVSVQIAEADMIIVAVGAMLCCGLGAIPPAWKASRLDPFDAIVEGRFR